MAGTKLGMIPLEIRVEKYWFAWIPLLDNEQYGLMMISDVPGLKNQRHIVIREYFDTPEAARVYADQWVIDNHDITTSLSTHRTLIPYNKGQIDLERYEAMKQMVADGVTLQEIADTYGISRQRVHQILNY
jgi:hypothetical protein